MKKIEIRPKGEGVRMVVTSLFSYFKNEPDIMTVPEAAKALRCGKNTIYDLIKEGKLNGVYVGNKIVVPKAALVEFILYEKNYVILKPEPRYLSWTSEKT